MLVIARLPGAAALFERYGVLPIDRYPPVLFKFIEGYGVDFGLYGSIFAPDVNHRRISGGHKDLGVLACSFDVESPPDSIEGVYETVLELL